MEPNGEYFLNQTKPSSSEQKEQSTHSNFFYQIWARFLLWLRRVFGGQSASLKTT